MPREIHMYRYPARTLFHGSELVEITISALVLSLAFSIAWRRLDIFPWALLTVGVGFIGHELAHKFTAQRFGFWASYRIMPMWLLLALLVSVLGMVFAALGAVQIFGRSVTGRVMSREEEGVISMAGPTFNIVLSAVFMVSWVLTGSRYGVLSIGAYLNALLAVFNLIPFWILDGQKIFAWDKKVWLLGFVVSAVLLILST